jgi:hypothetical protein
MTARYALAMAALLNDRWFTALCWAVLSVVGILSPLLLLFAWPVTGAACVFVVFATIRGLRSVAHQREPVRFPPHARRWLWVGLFGTIACAVGGAVSSIEPSMAFRSKSGTILYEHGLSIAIAPVLWSVILIVAARALRLPSPRRLAIVAATTMGSWPILLAIRALRVPVFDIDDQFVMLSPWAIYAYVVCVAGSTGSAIYLATMAKRLGTGAPLPLPLGASAINA